MQIDTDHGATIAVELKPNGGVFLKITTTLRGGISLGTLLNETERKRLAAFLMGERRPKPLPHSDLNQAIMFCAANGYVVLDVTELSDEECLEEIRAQREALADSESAPITPREPLKKSQT